MDCGCAQVQLGRDWADTMFSDPCTPERAQQCCLTKFHHINFKRFLKSVMILKVISVDLTLARARSIGPSPYSNDKILR